jgi:4-diphosphocytidyl-2-C-methyl-D-erythritol kinase
MIKRTIIKAPAKVNYLLDVIRRRPDNYHDLRMIMQRIDLCDDIEIVISGNPGTRVSCGRDGVPEGSGNIAWRAVEALRLFAPFEHGVEVYIKKNIPVAAGLGGGSSDAASVLMGLNEILGLNISEKVLMSIGLTLGADVPFFIFKKTALAEGIGDQLTAIHGLPPVWLVLVNPNIHVSTAWVYQNLQLTKDKDIAKLPEFRNAIDDVCALLSNDLEPVTISRFPVIRKIKELLLGHGAKGALMSGSGPTVFSVFDDESAARRCCEMMAENNSWFTAVARTI